MTIIDTAPKKRGVDGRGSIERIIGQGTNLIRSAGSLLIEVARHQPDVVHVTSSGSLSLIRDLLILQELRILGVPSVYHLHFGRVPSLANGQSWEWRALKVAMRLASRTISIDLATEQAIRESLPEVEVHNIANPIAIATLPLTQQVATKTVIFLGWVTREKGIEDLLSAWESVSQSKPQWKLRLVGPCEPQYRDQLNRKFSCVNVQFEGEHSHSEALKSLATCEVHILPSHTEGFPNVVLEAMSLGKPVVATAVGALPEMLDGGQAGILVAPHAPKELEAALVSLMTSESLRLTLGSRAAQRVQTHYAAEVVMSQYIAVWRAAKASERRH